MLRAENADKSEPPISIQSHQTAKIKLAAKPGLKHNQKGMVAPPEDQAILKPIWIPVADRVRRGSSKWRIWVLGPRPTEGAWFPREQLWVWKWWSPHASDHGEWLWRGEEPVFEQVPDSLDSAWRLVGARPSLQWIQTGDASSANSHYDRIWTEEGGTVCFAGDKNETLQFVAVSRVNRLITDRTTLVFDQESEEIPIHEELIERMRRSGDALPSEILRSTLELMPASDHLLVLREQSSRALESGLEVGVALLEGHRGDLSVSELLENYLRLLCLDFDLLAAEIEGVQEGVSKISFSSEKQSPEEQRGTSIQEEILLPRGILRFSRLHSGESFLRAERLTQPKVTQEVVGHIQRLLGSQFNS